MALVLSLAQAANADSGNVGASATLAQLGYTTQLLRPSQRVETRSFRYRLPGNAAQGKKTWYLLRLHFRIQFDPQTHPGYAVLSGLTDGRAAVQIQFFVARRHGRLRIGWTSLDLLNGLRNHVASSPAIDVADENYLQLAGVRPGDNTLTVRVEQYGGIHIRSVRIFRDTGVLSTRLGPAKLKLSVLSDQQRFRAGEMARIGFRLSNVGGQPARSVVVRPNFNPRALALVSRPIVRFRMIRHSAAGAFRFHVRRAGYSQVALEVSSNSSNPGALLALRAEPGGGTNWLTRLARKAFLGIVFVPALLVLLLPVPKRRASQARFRG